MEYRDTAKDLDVNSYVFKYVSSGYTEKNGKPKDEAVFIGRVNKSGEAPPKQVMLTGEMHGTTVMISILWSVSVDERCGQCNVSELVPDENPEDLKNKNIRVISMINYEISKWWFQINLYIIN